MTTINNYRLVSLLPIYGKIFERLILNSLFEYLEEHNLLSAHQSSFPLSIIYIVFDAFPTLESCGVFLDMSKAFDLKYGMRDLFLNLNQWRFLVLY